jgi:nucleoside-diphosphate-sugar epimerase
VRIFVAGASGAIGRRLLPMLVAAGHDVTGTTRSSDRTEPMRAAGARPVVVDALDPAALIRTVVDARPDVIIHQLTDLGPSSGTILSDDQLARTARIRRVATANLMDAAVAAGVSRMVAQSLALLYAPGPVPHPETDPLGMSEPWMALALPGVQTLERLVMTTTPVDGVLLRYGLFYGPGAATPAPSGPTTVHIDAAASAAALAVDHGSPGIYNIVDDGGPVANQKARDSLGWSPATRRAR